MYYPLRVRVFACISGTTLLTLDQYAVMLYTSIGEDESLLAKPTASIQSQYATHSGEEQTPGQLSTLNHTEPTDRLDLVQAHRQLHTVPHLVHLTRPCCQWLSVAVHEKWAEQLTNNTAHQIEHGRTQHSDLQHTSKMTRCGLE